MEPKERVLRHASTLFLRNGIRSVSMDDIAAHLAMSKKTLYKLFANKDELVLAVLSARLDQTQSDCTRVKAAAANVVEEMLTLSRWAEEQFSNIHPSIFHDLRKYHPAAWQLFSAHKSAFLLDQLREILERGIAEGLFRPELDVEVLARLHLAQLDLAFDPELYPLAEFAPARVNRVFDDHFLRGVVTLAGHQLIEDYYHSAQPATT